MSLDTPDLQLDVRDQQTGADRSPRRLPEWASWRSRSRRLLLALNTVVAAAYLVWWLMPGHMGQPVLFLLLALAEAFTFLHVVGLWWTFSGSPRQDSEPHVPPVLDLSDAARGTIDVMIPTYGEPLPVLHRTITAAVAMRGEHTTYVLDDACRPEVEELAQSLGARYIPRVESVGAKAGNINHALGLTDGAFFAIFDADHAPDPDFLERMMPALDEPSVAFVQSPQYYENGDTDYVARGAYDQQAIFYGPICRGKDALDAGFCCGTNVVFRRAAVQDVGGFDQDSVVEDFVTSMSLHRRGWTSRYEPFVLASGLGPTTLASYFGQQFRWARGSVGALADGQPFRPGFTLVQRLQYLLATTFYLTGIVTTIYMVLPVLYLTLGISAFSADSATFVFFYAPYLFLGLLTIRLSLGGQLRLSHLQFTFGTFPVYALASLAALLHLPARFKVTSKDDEARVRPPALGWVTVGMSATILVSVVVGIATKPFDAQTVTNLSWSVVNLLLLGGVTLTVLREWRTGLPVPARRTVRGRLATQPLPELALGVRSSRLLDSVPRPAMVVLLLTAAGAALRLLLVNSQSLWLDESLTLKQASMSLAELWRFELQNNVHVPLYHTLIHFWIPVFGTSEISLRLPSVLMGAACIPLMYAVTRRITSQRTALIATAVAAVNPFLIWHSTEARMYSALVLVSLLGLLMLMRAAERPSFARWAGYALVVGASLYVHYFALLMLAVHGAWLLVVRARRGTVVGWFVSAAVAGLAFLPWIVALYALRLSAHGGSDFTNGIRSVDTGATVFGSLYAILIFMVVLVTGYHSTYVLGALAALVFGAWPLIIMSSAMSGRVLGWARTRKGLFVAGWALGFVLLTYAADFVKPGVWLERYVSAAAIPLMIVVAAVVGLVGRNLRTVLVGVVLVGTVLTAGQMFEPDNPVRQDFRSAIAAINDEASPGDAVLVLPTYNRPVVAYYLEDGVTLVAAGSRAEPPEEVLREVVGSIADDHPGGRLYVVSLYTSVFDPDDTVSAGLESRFRVDGVERYGPELQVTTYQLPSR